jgi:TonB family protein
MRPTLPLSALALVAACGGEPAPPPAPPAAGAVTPYAPPARPAEAPRAPAPDWGEPDMAKIQRLFRARFAEVKRCYEAELQRDPQARGRLTLRFTIAEGGALRDVAVARSTFARRDVPGCVVEVVRRWKTPFRPAEPVEVEYPFSFSPR